MKATCDSSGPAHFALAYFGKRGTISNVCNVLYRNID